MNSKGYYCVARYGGRGGGTYGMSKADSIMLKFRPIAPKPIAVGSNSNSSTTDKYLKCGRSKRRYVRVNKSKKIKYSFKRSSSDKKMTTTVKTPPSSQPMVTLSLLPETPDRKEIKPDIGFSDLVLSSTHNNNNKKVESLPLWLSCFNNHPALSPTRRPQVVSNVTVECVTTDTWVYWEGLGCTDEERVMNMEKDTCPRFISDGEDRVVWTNKAYRQMVGMGHVVDGEDVEVVLIRKDKWIPSPVTCPAFTCKVRVTFATRGGRQTLSPSSPTLTLPCDGWRMSRGACAWRLDVNAALSLGR